MLMKVQSLHVVSGFNSQGHPFLAYILTPQEKRIITPAKLKSPE